MSPRAQDHIGQDGGAATPAAPKEKPAQIGSCCKAAPPVLEFDQQGKLVQGWGQGSYDDMSNWPREPHGIFVDHNDFVWIGSYNRHRVMKFTRDGKRVLTLGEYEKTGGSADTHLLGGPSGIWVDPANNEVYISDGYRNRRVIVVDGAHDLHRYRQALAGQSAGHRRGRLVREIERVSERRPVDPIALPLRIRHQRRGV